MAPTILLVDDSSIIREAVRMTLNKTPFRLVVASTAEEALQKLDSDRIDMALIDLRLPDADGYGLCRRIKSRDGYAALPVLILTHVNENIDRNRSRECGALGSFPKPFDTQDLLDQLQMILEDKLADTGDEEEIEEVDLEEVVEFTDGEEIITTDEILAQAGIEGYDSPLTLSKEQAAALLEPLEEDDDEEEAEGEALLDEAVTEELIEVEEELQSDDVFISHEPRAENIHSYFADENKKLESLRHLPLSEIDNDQVQGVAGFAFEKAEETHQSKAAEHPADLDNWLSDDLEVVEPVSDDGIEISGLEGVDEDFVEAEIPAETEADWMAREMAREINAGFESADDDIAVENLPSGLVEDEDHIIGDEVLAGVENDIEQSMLDDLVEPSPAAAAEEQRSLNIPENMVEFAPVEELSVPAEPVVPAPAPTAAPSESSADIVALFRRAIREEMAGLMPKNQVPTAQAAEVDIEKIRLAIVPELKTYLRQTVREEIASALSERRAPRYLEDFRAALKSELLREIRQSLEEKPTAAAFDPAALEGVIKDALASTPVRSQEPDLKMLASIVRKSIQMEIGKEIGERAQSVAWEVVPELAEILIKQKIGELNK